MARASQAVEALDRFKVFDPVEPKASTLPSDKNDELIRDRKQFVVRLSTDGWTILNRLKKHYGISGNALIHVVLVEHCRAIGLDKPAPLDPRPLSQQFDPKQIDNEDKDLSL